MIDLAVKLVGFDAMAKAIPSYLPPEFTVKRSDLSEAVDVYEWVRREFSRRWAGQYFDAAGAGKGIHATDASGKIVGFSAWDVPKLGYFGPLGTGKEMRGRGIGKALTVLALLMMQEAGYGFAMIHHVGPVEFYGKFLTFTKVKT